MEKRSAEQLKPTESAPTAEEGTKTASRRSAAKSAARKTTAAKSAAKKTATSKSAARKTAAAKSTAKKTTTSKSAAKKTAATKSAAKKTATSKSAAKKTATSKSAARKTAATKSAAKKTAASKSAARRTTAASKSAAAQAAKPAQVTAPAMPAKSPEAPLRILLISPEVRPFSGTGGLGEVAGSLPRALNSLPGRPVDCRVITPLYGGIAQKYREQMTFLGHKDIPVAWRQKYMGVFELTQDGVTTYFIDNEEYFKREGLYGYYDDCERFAFFSRAVFEALDLIGFQPEILHANDWQTALVPIYQDAIYHLPFVTTIFTIHNVEYQGHYSEGVIHDVLGLPDGAEHLVDYNGDCNLMKGGITTANLVSTVSPSYAGELKDPAFAFGMDPIIRENEFKLRGILNGIDTIAYDPSRDPLIPAVYTAEDLSGKAVCRTAIQEELGLPVRDVPVMALISRLVPAKGIDLMTASLDEILSANDCQLIILGTGNFEYEDYFRGLQARHPDQVRAEIRFDGALSHRIYAGSGILLMPSRSEPCGLSQMIACRYGTVPVVRATGGLRDSIQDCTLGDGSGFLFERYDPADFRAAVTNALTRFWNRDDWQALVRHDLGLDFSWKVSARTYLDMYREIAR